MLVCVPLVIWLGFYWAAIPAFLSSFLVAWAGGMSFPWIPVFALANPLSLALYAMLYRLTGTDPKMRSLLAAVGFLLTAFVASMAGSVGSFIWAHTNNVGLNTAYPVWQGWWLGGWLQAVCFCFPVVWLASKGVNQWLQPVRTPRPLASLRQRLLAPLLFSLAALAGYVATARWFSLAQFDSALRDITNPRLIEPLQNAVDGLSYPLFALLVVIAAGAYFAFLIAVHWNRELVEANLRLEKLASLDELSGILNRRSVFLAIEAEVERQKRNGRPLSILMIDADHFKRINDLHGHAVGDAVIRELAGSIAAQLRRYDLVGRYGGEEFIVCLPNTDERSSRQIGNRILASVRAVVVETEAGPVSLTVSIGGATGVAVDSLETLVDSADRALLQAKRQGRDRLHIGAADGELR